MRQRALASIAREVKGEAIAAGAPKEPLVEVKAGADAVFNDVALTARMVATVKGALGEQNVVPVAPKMTSEDFANFGQAGIKSVLLHFGAANAARLAESKKTGIPLLGTHSPQWAPEFQPSVRAVIAAETAIMLDQLSTKK